MELLPTCHIVVALNGLGVTPSKGRAGPLSAGPDPGSGWPRARADPDPPTTKCYTDIFIRILIANL